MGRVRGMNLPEPVAAGRFKEISIIVNFYNINTRRA
jgi:hypothetical protein